MAWVECKQCKEVLNESCRKKVQEFETCPDEFKPPSVFPTYTNPKTREVLVKVATPCEEAKPPGALPRDCGFPNQYCGGGEPLEVEIGTSQVCPIVRGHEVKFVSGPGPRPPQSERGYPCNSGLENIIKEVNCMAANPCYPNPKDFTCTCDGEEIECPQCPDNPNTSPDPGDPGYKGEPYLGDPNSEEGYQKVASEIINKQNKICRNDCQKRLEAKFGKDVESGFRFRINTLNLKATGSVSITVETADGKTLTLPPAQFEKKIAIGGAEFTIPIKPICKVQRTAQQSYPNYNRGSPNHRDWDGPKQKGQKEGADKNVGEIDPPDGKEVIQRAKKNALPGRNQGKNWENDQVPKMDPVRGGLYIDESTEGQRVQVLPMIVYYTTSWGFPAYAARTRPAGENAECTQFIFDVFVAMSQQEYFGTNITGGQSLGGLCDSNTAFTDASQWEHGEGSGGGTPIVVPEPGLNFTLCPGDGKNVVDEMSKIGKNKQPLAPFVRQYESMLDTAETWALATYSEFGPWVMEQVGAAFGDGVCRVTFESSFGGISKGV